MQDRLTTIAIFVAVAELESFAEAARRLNRTPAAVTRAVAALEEELQTRLLNRTTRSVALTEDGARHLEVCRRLLAAHDELMGMTGDAPEKSKGVLNVTAPTMFGRLHVIPAIVLFLEAFPRMSVRALLVDRVVSLIDEGLDVGVRIGELPDSSLRAVKVGDVHLGVYGSPEYLDRHGEPATPNDLAAHATISCTAIMPVAESWSFDDAPSGSIHIHPRLVVNTAESAADAAAGLGLTYIVSYQAQTYVASGRLRRVLTNFAPELYPIHLIHPSGRFAPPKVRHFIEHVGGELRRKFAQP